MRSFECNQRGSALNGAVCGRPRSSTSVRLSCLGCLTSLEWFACSPSLSFFCITPLHTQLRTVQFPSWYRRYDRVSTSTRSQFYCSGNSTAMATQVPVETLNHICRCAKGVDRKILSPEDTKYSKGC